jgi:hypothetical protein
MLYIHIKGGQWAARSKSEPEHPSPAPSPDGEVGWMPTIDTSEEHESRNIGKEPIDLVWVTLKHRAGSMLKTHEAVTKTPPQGAGKDGLRGSDTPSID